MDNTINDFKAMPRFATLYDGNNKRPKLECDPDEDLTLQTHKEECDIHNIISQYDRNGLIAHVNTAVANYGDYTTVNEYQESLNMVIKANDAFSELPSEVRRHFNENAGLFFEFATNPENHDRMVEWGLAEPKVVEAIQTATQSAEPPPS